MMDRREWMQGSAAMALLGGWAGMASAQEFVEGKHYVKLPAPVPVTAPAGKIEVVEFFWYGCPHCNAFEPALDAWSKKLPADVAFRRVHVGFRPSFEPQQRLSATLEALGWTDNFQRKIFHAIHVQRQRLDRPEEIIDFIEKNGGDKAKFVEMYNSFGMQAKVRQGKQLSEAYKIDGVPAIGIQGRFYTSPSLAGGENTPEVEGGQRCLTLADQLIARVRKG
jgi:protein dithiol oxidoreductase (disulfide-forming)